MNFFFDRYELKARLLPGILGLSSIILPLIFLLDPLISQFGATSASAAILTLFCGILVLLNGVLRDRGKAIEVRLFRSWGGKPSLAMLRHRDHRLNLHAKTRYRAFIERTVPNLKLATPEEERKDPCSADDGYETATLWLLAQTGDHKRFGLLFQENINYGFRRSMLAVKPWALAADAAMIIAITIAEFWAGIRIHFLLVDAWTWAAISFAIFHMITFLFLINASWVRSSAEIYARRLLAACDILDQHLTSRLP